MNLYESRVRIYNLALTKLGVTERLTTYSDDTVEAGAFTAVWEQVLHEVLELGEWRCARRRMTLMPATGVILDADLDDSVVLLTVSPGGPLFSQHPAVTSLHPFENGDLIKISDVVGMTELNDNTYMVGDCTLNGFTLYEQDGTATVDGTAFTEYVSGGTISRVQPFGYEYAFELPNDCIKVIETSLGEADWVEENNLLLTNQEADTVDIVYIRYLADPMKFSPLLAECVATRLASVCCMALSKSLEKQRVLDAEFAAILSLARGQDARWRSTPDAASTLITEV